MSVTEEVALTDVLSFIVDNRGRSCPTSPDGFPLIATNCLRRRQRYPTFENVRYVSEDTYTTWFRAHPEPQDVLFVCKGSPGRVAIVPEPVSFCIAQDMVALRADHSRIDPAFLYYRLSADDVQAAIVNMHVGTMIPHFKKGDFGRLRFAIPVDITEQRAIAEVLSALDDKIAANAKLATAADDLACAEFLKAAASAKTGSRTYADIASIGGGGTPRSAVPEYWDGDVLWLTPTDVTGLNGPYVSQTSRKITEAGLAATSSALYPVGSIFMTSRATIGAFAIAEAPTAVNQGFIVVQPHDERLRYWLFHEMRSRVPEYLDHANGATFMELSRGNFKKLPVTLADDQTMRAFGERVAPLHARASAALHENSALATTRDALLPGLMSGRLRVRDAERLAEDPGAVAEQVAAGEGLF